MEEELKKKRLKELSDPAMENAWLKEGIMVKILAKSLGDRYYKKKGRVVDVTDDFAALVQLKDVGAKVRVDQDDLETVIPNVGRMVVILWGKYDGEEAELTRIDTKKFQAELKLSSGKLINLPYEQFSKLYVDKDEISVIPSEKNILTINIDD